MLKNLSLAFALVLSLGFAAPFVKEDSPSPRSETQQQAARPVHIGSVVVA